MNTIELIFEASNLTLDDIVEATGLHRDRLLAIIEGRWLPSPRERQIVAEALGCRATEISWGHTMSPRNVRYHRYGLKTDFRPRQ